LSVVSYSYCYSDVIYGSTNNAASNGMQWRMEDVLPPQAGLTINGMLYQYTTEKDPDSDLTVTIRNKHALAFGEYIFSNTDDWSGLPGNTINKKIAIPETSTTLWGDGEISIQGQGSVTNPNVIYEYRYDECYIPLTDPSCPGYYDALYQWLKDNGLLDKEPEVGDPYYDEWVQYQLSLETDLEDNDEVEQDDDEEVDEDIAALNVEASIDKLVDASQSQMYIELSTVPQFDKYYTQDIPGGVYQETVVLQDATLPDNRRALNNLAGDAKHRTMVRSQYGD